MQGDGLPWGACHSLECQWRNVTTLVVLCGCRRKFRKKILINSSNSLSDFDDFEICILQNWAFWTTFSYTYNQRLALDSELYPKVSRRMTLDFKLTWEVFDNFTKILSSNFLRFPYKTILISLHFSTNDQSKGPADEDQSIMKSNQL